MQVLTEGEIGAAIERNLAGTRAGDSIDIAMFYLSERDVIEALIAAAKRGVVVRVILDPNKDAFGRSKDGIPNRSVATELARRLRRRHQGALVPHARRAVPQPSSWRCARRTNSGSRWVRPISRDAISRTSTSRPTWRVSVPPTSELATAIGAWFEMIWTNHGPPDLEYTAEFGTYADPAQGTYWLYRLMEATGLSTF